MLPVVGMVGCIAGLVTGFYYDTTVNSLIWNLTAIVWIVAYITK
jgi:ABC-type Mn2+/Zn2+ transport system permease subunit